MRHSIVVPAGFRAAIAGLVLALLPSVLPAESEPDRLANLRTYLNGLNTLEADFEQQVLNDDGELIESAAGTVQLKKPGRFRWNYSEPYERVVVADGERVWVYEADLEQVTVRRLGAGLGETPAALLTGDTGALDQFEYVTDFSADGIDWIALRPKAADADFSSISLGFAAGTLIQLELRDRLGQRTRLGLSNIVNGRDIAEEAFVFVVPENADVIGETDL